MLRFALTNPINTPLYESTMGKSFHSILRLTLAAMMALSGGVVFTRPCCCGQNKTAQLSSCCAAKHQRTCPNSNPERSCACHHACKCGCGPVPHAPMDRTTIPIERADDEGTAVLSLSNWSITGGIANSDFPTLVPGQNYSIRPPLRVLYCTWLN